MEGAQAEQAPVPVQAQPQEFGVIKAANYDSMAYARNMTIACAKILLKMTTSHSSDLKLPELDLTSDYEIGPTLGDTPADSIFRAKGINIMDFGCGTGLVSQYIVKEMAEDSTFTGVDISADMLENFDKKPVLSEDPRVKTARYHLGDDAYNKENNLPVPDFIAQGQRFDIIFSTLSFHHLDCFDATLCQLQELLKPDGVFVCLDFYNPDSEKQQAHSHGHGEALAHGDGHEHGHGHGHSHATPSKSNFHKSLTSAKFTNIDIAECAARFKIFWPEKVIKNHCKSEMYTKLQRNELEKRKEKLPDGNELDTFGVIAQFCLITAKA